MNFRHLCRIPSDDYKETERKGPTKIIEIGKRNIEPSFSFSKTEIKEFRSDVEKFSSRSVRSVLRSVFATIRNLNTKIDTCGSP